MLLLQTIYKNSKEQLPLFIGRYFAYTGIRILWYVVFLICFTLVAGATILSMFTNIENPTAPMVGSFGIATIFIWAIYMAFDILFQLARLRSAVKLSIGETKENIRQECTASARTLPQFILSFIIVGFLSCFSLLLLIIPGLYIIPRLAFFAPAIAHGTHSAFNSISYSWQITKNRWWSTITSLVLPQLALYLIGAVGVVLLMSLAIQIDIIGLKILFGLSTFVYAIVFFIFAAPLSMLFYTNLYQQLIKENLPPAPEQTTSQVA